MRQVPRFQIRALAAAALLAFALPALAQSSNATLRGTVSSAGKATPNAEVVATNVATGYTLRIRANANGDYALIGLPPGTYRIVANADGQVSQSQVTLQVGQAASLDLAVAAAAAPGSTTLETVTVVGAANVQDKDTSEVGTYVTTQQLQRLPQVTRNFLSQADLAPGVNVEYDSQGNVKLRSGASARDAINVFIDGVGQKDYVLRGGTSGQDNSRGNPFPQSAIGEYKVITQNYKAEYDQVSSAVITAATKSGTNEFHGDAFYDHTGSNLRAATPQEKIQGYKADTSQEQYGVSLGGAIEKDVLHYFIAYEGKDNHDPQSVVAAGGPTITSLLPASASALQGGVQSPFHEDLLFTKLDYSLDDRNHFDVSFKYRNEHDRKNLGGTETSPFSSNNTIREQRFDLHHQFTSDRYTNELRLTYENVFFGQIPVGTDNGVIYTYFPENNTNPTTVLQTGGNNFFQQKTQKGLALQEDFTYTGLASHVIKMGAKIKWVTVDALEQGNGTPQYFYDLQSSTPTTPYRVDVGYPLSGIGDGSTSSKNKQLGLYLQDDWEVTQRLTLNLGARYDIEWSPTYLDHVTPADVLAAVNGQDTHTGAPVGQTYAQTLAKGGVDINDYISTGGNRKSFSGGFAPRVGFSFDLTGDKRNVVFGGYGRSYDRNIFDVLQLENTKGTFPSATIQFNGVNGGCAPGQSTCLPYQASYGTRAGLAPLITQNAGREVDLLKNDLKTPYSDQFSVGIRNAIGGDWQTEATYSYIQQRDGFVWLLGNRQPDGSFYNAGHVSGPPFGNGIPGMGSLLLGTNGVKSNADSLFLKLDKPYTKSSHWGATFAYTYTHARENHNSADDFSYLLDYPTVSASPMLQSSAVPVHKLVATGTYDLPWGIIVSGKVTLATPKVQRDFNCTGQVNNDCIGDTVKLRSFRQWDLSLSKAFTVPAGVNLGVRLDVINLFNNANWQDYNVAWGAPDTANVATPTGTLSSPPRTVKVGFFANWYLTLRTPHSCGVPLRERPASMTQVELRNETEPIVSACDQPVVLQTDHTPF